MRLTISNIEKLIETGKLPDNIKIIAEIFLSAINDWPEPVLTLEAYEEKVRKFINTEPTKKAIEFALKNIDVINNAWKAESLSQILEIFHLYSEDMSLKDIIAFLKSTLK